MGRKASIEGIVVVQSLSNRVVARMAAVLFLVSGGLSVVTAFLPIQPGANRAGELVVGLAAIAIGGFAWLAPWQRWRRSSTLGLPVLAFGVLAATELTGSAEAATFATYFVVVFVWVGIAHPRWTSARLLPIAVVAYVAPLVSTDQAATALDSGLEVAVLCLLVGEALAWVSERLRIAEVVDERRSYQMQQLLRAGELLARENEPTRLPGLAAELAVQLLRTHAAVVLLVEGDGALRSVRSFRWPEEAEVSTLTASPELRRVMESDRVAVLDRERLERDLGFALPFPAVLAMPLAGTTRPQGVLLAGLKETSPIDEFAQDAARTFATQAGLALERVQAAQSLLAESLRDELTGLGNRRYANVALADSTAGDAIVVIDLDRFKELNDARGHAAGDDVLKMLAAHLRTALRDNDTAARLGGDEFLLILRGIGDNAVAALDRLEQRWRSGRPPVTYSAGVAMRRDDESSEQTLARADAALYAGKDRGRDRVTVAS